MSDRRSLLVGAGAALVPLPNAIEPATGWYPEPMQRPVQRRMVAMSDGTRLDCWDSGGTGETVVLLHPNTGSNAVWGYQQPVLVDAGYRIIAYSRRGVGRSDTGPAQPTVTAVEDLITVLDTLEVERAHLVGSAAGGFIVPDAALAVPARLLSLTIACSTAGIVEYRWRSDGEMLIPQGFRELPPDFRELSGSYRLENPVGRARWLELEHEAASKRIPQPAVNRLDFQAIARIALPLLVITGDADPYLPPARARMLAAMVPGAEIAVIKEAAHSAYWEQPDAFNATLLQFLRRNHVGKR